MSKVSLKNAIRITIALVGTVFAITVIIAKKKKSASVYKDQPDQKNPLEGKKVVFVADENEKENADGARGHLEAVGEAEYHPSFYERYVKRAFDIVLSFGGLVVLSPVMAAIAIAIKVEDPGPVLFTQKRLGQNKRYFKLHKFRSMKMCTPHDVPTHMLENPDQYITKVGKFIRAHSLDELPQIWDIFIGNMSVIGPRPGLWNQDILTAERDKYGANDVKPGLTGWAQINGRDELEVPVKAKLDGEYVQNEGFLMDMKCFLGSLHVFGKDDSVVEGGTGEMKKVGRHHTDGKSKEEMIGHIGFGEPVVVDKDKKVKVLVVGAGSYIGESFATYVKDHYSENITVDTVDTMPKEKGEAEWQSTDFSPYDIVYHVAGIAHADVGNVSDETKEKYYKVNTDLTIDVAKKAKLEGVKEFIFMSSMIVYGDSAPYGQGKMITKDTVPAPANFYGDSKLQADVAVRELADDKFKVVVLRPPMIYGKGSKGNYPTLAKLAKKLPVFPNVDNQRSMLHIDNLCEFLCQLMLVSNIKQKSVVLVPQNGEYTRTDEMVKEISEVAGGKIVVTALLNPVVKLAGLIPGKVRGLVNKAFGNSCFDLSMSDYEGMNYRMYDLKDSIRVTEKVKHVCDRKKVLFLVNHDVVIYNFRLEIVERLLQEGYEVHISSPYGERIDDLVKLGAVWHDITIDRHGMNPAKEWKLFYEYKQLLKEVKPDIILGFTIKPNIYGAIAAKQAHIPFVANITGLGTAVEDSGWKQKIFIALYKYAFTDVQRVFFQNTENQQFFIKHKIALKKQKLLPGSGVNVDRFPLRAYPEAGDGKSETPVRFAFISRIMKEKGIDQYLEAAKAVKKEYPATEFHICGFCEKEYEGQLDEYNKNGIVIYHGMIRDVSTFLKNIHCVIHPTYYPEGLSNVLLEACSSGRPIITTDRSGCREVVEDGINGYMIQEKNNAELIRAIRKFLALCNDNRMQMGLAGRKKVVREFNRMIVVDSYVEEVESAIW